MTNNRIAIIVFAVVAILVTLVWLVVILKGIEQAGVNALMMSIVGGLITLAAKARANEKDEP